MSLQSTTIWGSKLDGNSNDVLAVANGTDTTITYSAGNGKINSGAGFGGASAIAISATPVLGSTTSPRSYSFWIKGTMTSGFIATGQVASNFHSLFDIFVNASGQIQYQMNPTNNGGDQLNCHSTTAINNGAFHHVLITYSGSKTVAGVHIYVDGVNTTVTSDTNNMSTTTVTIDEFRLGDRGGAGGSITAAIDEFYVFNAELTSGDATTLSTVATGQYPFTAGVAYTLTAALGTFTLTGIAALFVAGRVMATSVGTFTLTGIDILFQTGKGFAAETGVFVLTGSVTNLLYRFVTRWVNSTKHTATAANTTKHNVSVSSLDKTNL